MATEHKAFDKARMSRFWGKVKTYVATAISGLYSKPSGGIPKSDLSSEVQTSLGKADSALQSFTESDPTVPSWAKQSSKPTYTAQEVGALPSSTPIPTKTSDLTNDSGFLTQHQSIKTIGGNTITGSGNIPWPTYTANDTGALPNTTTLADLEDATHKTVTSTEKATWNGKQDALTGYAGSPSIGGVANKAASIPYGETDASSTATAYTATIDGIIELRDGVCCILRNTARTSASGFTLNINNLGAKPLYSANRQNLQEGYTFLVNNTYLLVYNTALGGWIMGKLSDENVDENACYLFNYTGIKTKTLTGRYMFCVTYDEEYVLPVNSYDGNTTTSKVLTTESFDIFGQVYFNNKSYASAADSRVGELYYARPTANMQYAFNLPSDLTLWKKVYLVCVPQSDGRVKLHSNPLSQSLPTTEDGLVYKLLGHMTSANQICLYAHKPCYYYKDGKLRLWTGG